MPEEPEKVAALIDKAAKKVAAHDGERVAGEEDAMFHAWFRVVLETSVQFGLAILPAAPLLGQKLPSIADEQRFSANHPTMAGSEKPNF